MDMFGDRYDVDTSGRSMFRNYAREYVLNDGSMGVDHFNTRNSNPLNVD